MGWVVCTAIHVAGWSGLKATSVTNAVGSQLGTEDEFSMESARFVEDGFIVSLASRHGCVRSAYIKRPPNNLVIYIDRRQAYDISIFS